MTRWLGAELVRLRSVTSTNDEAMARARAGARHGTVVVAEVQTKGRGRGGHLWWSPNGENLYLSAVLRLPLPPSAAPPLTLAAGVAVCDAAHDLGVEAKLKWPNDVLVGGKKLAGILTETSSRGDRLESVVVGIGLNVDTREFPPDLLGVATSLRLAKGGGVAGPDSPRIGIAPVLTALLTRLEEWIDRFVEGGAAQVARAWKDRSAIFGKKMQVAVEGRIVIGTARDLDDDGALLIDGDDGKRWRVVSGEIVEARG
jgi:BirA family biotin operon repressor/biotin-[acetyl-CoA-carboxylase] ligase